MLRFFHLSEITVLSYLDDNSKYKAPFLKVKRPEVYVTSKLKTMKLIKDVQSILSANRESIIRRIKFDYLEILNNTSQYKEMLKDFHIYDSKAKIKSVDINEENFDVSSVNDSCTHISIYPIVDYHVTLEYEDKDFYRINHKGEVSLNGKALKSKVFSNTVKIRVNIEIDNIFGKVYITDIDLDHPQKVTDINLSYNNTGDPSMNN